MNIAVYPRLGDILAARDVTVPELQHKIRERFGLSVPLDTFYWLMLAEEPIRQIDLQIIGATAAVLDIALDDLFTVATTTNGISNETATPVLDPLHNQRLHELLDKHGHATLSASEREELADLVATYNQRVHERRLREIAAQESISVEQARGETAAQVAAALQWWRAINADPQRRQVAVEQALRQRARQAE